MWWVHYAASNWKWKFPKINWAKLLFKGGKICFFGLLTLALISYLVVVVSEYYSLREDVSFAFRYAIINKEALQIADELEEKLEINVDIEYYKYMPQGRAFFFGMIGSPKISGYYHVVGAWPAENQEIILLSSDIINYLDEDHKRFIIGHELGHVKEDHYYRGRGFALANRVLLDKITRKLAFKKPTYWQTYLWGEQLKRQFVADDYGVQCSSPETAVEILTVMMLDIGPDHPGYKFLRMRIQRLIRKYGVYKK